MPTAAPIPNPARNHKKPLLSLSAMIASRFEPDRNRMLAPTLHNYKQPGSCPSSFGDGSGRKIASLTALLREGYTYNISCTPSYLLVRPPCAVALMNNQSFSIGDKVV